MNLTSFHRFSTVQESTRCVSVDRLPWASNVEAIVTRAPRLFSIHARDGQFYQILADSFDEAELWLVRSKKTVAACYREIPEAVGIDSDSPRRLE